MDKFLNGWDDVLDGEFCKDYYKRLRSFLKEEYFSSHKIYPEMHNIFNCFRLTPLDDVKVVILGQDPYHGPGQAHGLCFSVQDGVQLPPSLKNIFKELKADVGITDRKNGDLTSWAKQGVLLLNTVLTVREGSPNSHKNMGWETFTDSVINHLNSIDRPIVFMLWGANARAKKPLLTNRNHLILEAGHPSPLSYTHFCGCKHFSKANEFLSKNSLKSIEW